MNQSLRSFPSNFVSKCIKQWWGWKKFKESMNLRAEIGFYLKSVSQIPPKNPLPKLYNILFSLPSGTIHIHPLRPNSAGGNSSYDPALHFEENLSRPLNSRSLSQNIPLKLWEILSKLWLWRGKKQSMLSHRSLARLRDTAVMYPNQSLRRKCLVFPLNFLFLYLQLLSLLSELCYGSNLFWPVI